MCEVYILASHAFLTGSQMGVYARYLLPRLTHLAMDRKLLLPYRQRVISGAKGRVLEIGVGSGLNLPLYGDNVEEVIGIDISLELLAMAERAAVLRSQRRHLQVRLLEGSAENLPSTIADGSVDTVVITWALCSIPDVGAALAEAHRVLRRNGSLRFVEHGRSPDASVAWWQDRLTPLWRSCSGGCHLNRKTDDLLRSAGFRLTHLATGYAPGPRPMAFIYEGQAEL
jgi:ubiquinone/menaquinone biosynthesis C-methylase UbiE